MKPHMWTQEKAQVGIGRVCNCAIRRASSNFNLVRKFSHKGGHELMKVNKKHNNKKKKKKKGLTSHTLHSYLFES